MKEPSPRRLACIDVGSGALNLLIVEMHKDRLRVLDELSKSVALGRDCFSTGSIQRATTRETCEILLGFRALLNEYKVDECRVVATSALREAANRDWVVDQIRVSTGFQVQVLSNAEEHYTTFKALDDGVENYRKMRREGMLIIDVGYGSTEISEIRNDRLVMSRNIRMGALRLWELISAAARQSDRYPLLLEEYILSNLDHVRAMVRLKDIPHCLVLSGEAGQLLKLADGHMTRKRFDQLYLTVRDMTPQEMERNYSIPAPRAEILLPTMMVIRSFMDMTGAESLHLTTSSLKEGVVAEMRDEALGRPDLGTEDMIAQAEALAARQHNDKKHARDVADKAIRLFDELRPLHDMTDRDRLMLRLGALTHDMGKRLSTVNHGEQSAHILLANPILGLNQRELGIVAFLGRYHSSYVSSEILQSSNELGPEDHLKAVKLLSILRLADAMDKGHRQKLSLEEIKLDGEKLTLFASANQDATLEKWIFEHKAELFFEIFGVKARLKVKRGDING